MRNKLLIALFLIIGLVIFGAIIDSSKPKPEVEGTQFQEITPSPLPSTSPSLSPTPQPSPINTPSQTINPTPLPTREPTPQLQQQTQSSGDCGTYINTAGERVPSPCYYDTAPSGATALCNDGTYSFSKSRRGTCSHHGGVAQWL